MNRKLCVGILEGDRAVRETLGLVLADAGHNTAVVDVVVIDATIASQRVILMHSNKLDTPIKLMRPFSLEDVEAALTEAMAHPIV